MNTYDNYHFIIDRSDFARAEREGRYGAPAGDLKITEITPTYETFKPLLDRYGGPWDWNRRPKYLDKEAVRMNLSKPETRLLEFCEKGKVIGYCLIVGVKDTLKDRFWESANALKVAEIENIALDLALTGHGRGRYFLERVLRDLLTDYDAIYLSSRSTNHKGIKHFYKSMGMTLAHTERGLPNDLLPVAEYAGNGRRTRKQLLTGQPAILAAK